MAIGVGSLVPRVYTDFRGIDATKRDITLTRSPETLNMWINYKDTLGKCIETRPGMILNKEFENKVLGIFFYKVGNVQMTIVHSGTKLYKIVNGETTEIYTGMNIKPSKSFVYNNMLYIVDGINYLKFDGQQIGDVVGYAPRTSISGDPKTGSRATFEWVNLLSDYRINSFVGDGESSVYKLDVESFDDEVPEVKVETKVGSTYEDVIYTPISDYTWDRTKGTITFIRIPDKPVTAGRDNVFIKFKKHVSGNYEKISHCPLVTTFNDTIFFAGNIDYPNVLWHSREDNPTYVPDINYNNEGLDLGLVKALIPGNNALWVIKEGTQSNNSVFYHVPVYTTDPDRQIAVYEYASTHSNISIGCNATGVNFGDDIIFFSPRGMEGIGGDITTEQFLAHRSSLVDALLLNEEEYKNMILEEYEGYLLVILKNKVYLCNSRSKFTFDDHIEYDWFYWELEKDITCTRVENGILYLGTEEGIYTLTDMSNEREIRSYWTTPEDEFGVGQYVKTTSKKGCVVDMKGEKVEVYTKTDNKEFEYIDTYTNLKEYVVCRIKKKKWKSIQLKFSSNKPFGLFSCDLQAYVGGYVKR